MNFNFIKKEIKKNETLLGHGTYSKVYLGDCLMALTKEQQDEMYKAVVELRSAIVGVNGKGGLIDEVQRLASGHGRLRRYFWILVSALVASGVITGGATGLFTGG